MGQVSTSLGAPGEGNVVGAGRPAAGSRPKGGEEESLSFQDVDLRVAEAGGLRAAPGVDEVLRSREGVFRIHHAALSCAKVLLPFRAVSCPPVYLDLPLTTDSLLVNQGCETGLFFSIDGSIFFNRRVYFKK